jgi:hypothetical protein
LKLSVKNEENGSASLSFATRGLAEMCDGRTVEFTGGDEGDGIWMKVDTLA